MDINGQYTQRDVDAAYENWKRAAAKAPFGGSKVEEALWQRFCNIQDKFLTQTARGGK